MFTEMCDDFIRKTFPTMYAGTLDGRKGIVFASCSPTTSSGVVFGVCLGGGRYRGSTRGVGLKVSVPVLLYS